MGQIPGTIASAVKPALSGLNNWPQYDPNTGGINPEGGPFIPKAPAAPAPPGTDYAAQQMRPFGDIQGAASLMGVTQSKKTPGKAAAKPASAFYGQAAPTDTAPSSGGGQVLNSSFLYGRSPR